LKGTRKEEKGTMEGKETTVEIRFDGYENSSNRYSWNTLTRWDTHTPWIDESKISNELLQIIDWIDIQLRSLAHFWSLVQLTSMYLLHFSFFAGFNLFGSLSLCIFDVRKNLYIYSFVLNNSLNHFKRRVRLVRLLIKQGKYCTTVKKYKWDNQMNPS
jgi:hypothetical protein